MSTQWHPLFARLLRLLLEEFYQLDTEVPVSDLPRKGDILLLRRTGSAEPPFTGLWVHLTDWNVLEFKGPTDSPQEADLELLMHVGTGITYRFNEERVQRGEEPLASRHISFWYLAPTLGESFLAQARARVDLSYETGGLWRGRAWGHPVFFLSYRDAPVEPDTVPLHFLTSAPATPPHSLVELLARRADLRQRFGQWLFALHPHLWEEVRDMVHPIAMKPAADYEIMAKYVDVQALIDALGAENVIQMLGAERVIQALGVERAVSAIGPERVIAALGPQKLVEAMGSQKIVEAIGPEKIVEAMGSERILEAILSKLTPEQERALRQRLLGKEEK